MLFSCNGLVLFPMNSFLKTRGIILKLSIPPYLEALSRVETRYNQMTLLETMECVPSCRQGQMSGTPCQRMVWVQTLYNFKWT